MGAWIEATARSENPRCLVSFGRFGPFDYQLMREIHAEIAAEHGVRIHASSRLSRGLEARPPADREIRLGMRASRALDERVTGRVVGLGGAPGRDDHGETAAAVTPATVEGERSFRGAALAEALAEAGVGRGDRIHLRRVEGGQGSTLSGDPRNEREDEPSRWQVDLLDRPVTRLLDLAAIEAGYRELGERALEVAPETEEAEEEERLRDLGQRLLAAAESLTKGEPVTVLDPTDPRPALDWLEGQAVLLRDELQGAFAAIAELSESSEKSALQERFAALAQDSAGLLQGAADLAPYITPPDPGTDLYAIPELDALRELSRFEGMPELAQALRLHRESIAEQLSAELTDGDIPAAGLVVHLMAGRSLSAGQLADRLREDSGAWLAAHGETAATAPPALITEASDWLIDRVRQAEAWLDAHPETIPTEVHGWMAFHHRPEAHDGRALAETSPRFAARLDRLSETDLDRLAKGDRTVFAGEIAIDACRRAFAAEALARHHDRLLERGHDAEELRAVEQEWRAPLGARSEQQVDDRDLMTGAEPAGARSFDGRDTADHRPPGSAMRRKEDGSQGGGPNLDIDVSTGRHSADGRRSNGRTGAADRSDPGDDDYSL